MALPYNKWSDDEIKNRNITDDGQYPFTVINSVLKQTKVQFDENGKAKPTHPMLELELEFHDINGVIKKQRDWIVFCEGMDWKLRHLAATAGLINLYDEDKLEAFHLKGKNGVLHLGIKDSEYKGEKRKQNYVKDYIKPDKETVNNHKKSDNSNDFIDDDINF